MPSRRWERQEASRSVLPRRWERQEVSRSVLPASSHWAPGLSARALHCSGGPRNLRCGRGRIHHGLARHHALARRDASRSAPHCQAASRAACFVAERSVQASVPILPRPVVAAAKQEAARSSIGMAAMLREARAASAPLEAWRVVAPVRLSARPEAQGALHAVEVSSAVAERPSAGPHAEAAAGPAVEQQEAAVPWAVLPEEVELRAGVARWVAALDALAVQPWVAQPSAAPLSVFPQVRFRRVTQPARVGPARIARAMAASSSTTRQ